MNSYKTYEEYLLNFEIDNPGRPASVCPCGCNEMTSRGYYPKPYSEEEFNATIEEQRKLDNKQEVADLLVKCGKCGVAALLVAGATYVVYKQAPKLIQKYKENKATNKEQALSVRARLEAELTQRIKEKM